MSPSPYRLAVRNSLSHFAAVAVNVGTNFLVLPVIVHGIGITEFGVWAIATTLIGYTAILDLGLGQTLIKKTSELVTLDDFEQLNAVMSLTFTLYCVIGLFVFLLGMVLVYVAPLLFQIPLENLSTFREILLILTVLAALSFPMSVIGGVLGGLQDFHFGNFLNMCLNIGKAAATIFLMHIGQGLLSLVVLGAAISVLGWILTFLWIKERIPKMRVGLVKPQRRHLVEMGRFSASMLIWSIAGQALQSLDRLVIVTLMPVRAVGLYEVGARLSTYSRTAINVVFVAMPTASALFAKEQLSELREFYLRGTRVVFAAYGGLVLAFVFLGREFIHLWMGSEFEQVTLIAQLLMIGNFFQSQNSLGHVILVGIGRLRVFTYVMGIYPFAIAALAVAFGLSLGLTGIALGVLLSVLILETVLLLHLMNVMSVTFRQMLKSVHLRVAPCLIATSAGMIAINSNFIADSWTAFVAKAVAFAAVYSSLFVMTGLSATERIGLIRALRRG